SGADSTSLRTDCPRASTVSTHGGSLPGVVLGPTPRNASASGTNETSGMRKPADGLLMLRGAYVRWPIFRYNERRCGSQQPNTTRRSCTLVAALLYASS